MGNMRTIRRSILRHRGKLTSKKCARKVDPGVMAIMVAMMRKLAGLPTRPAQRGVEGIRKINP